MEHYRRLGFADEVRALGMPADFPTDIAYFTRFASHELARFSLPSARDARQLVKTLSGSWSAAELPHRCNQKFIEPVLRRHAERLAGVSVRYGWRMTRFETLENEVRGPGRAGGRGPSRTVRARYLVGADGPRSPDAPGARHPLRRRDRGHARLRRRPHVRCLLPRPRLLPRDCRIAPAWMNVNFNRERRCFMPAVDGRQRVRLSHPAEAARGRSARDRRVGRRDGAAGDRRAARGRGAGARHVDGGPFAGGRALRRRPRLHRRGRGAPFHADRRPGLQHRGRGRGEPRLEALPPS